jgi:hypothetical protein
MLGAETLLTMYSAGGDDFVARLPGIVRVGEGDQVKLTTRPSDLRLFDPETGQALAVPDPTY